MKDSLKTLGCIAVLSLFWGLLYPQYAITEDMYRIKKEEGIAWEKDCGKDYARMRSARPGEVEIKFSLVEKWKEWFGEKEDDEDGGKPYAGGGAHRGL